MVGDNLLRFNKKQKYLIFDGESANLNLLDLENVPWEWGFMVCTLDEVIEKQDYLVKWDQINISAEAARITGFYRNNIPDKIELEGKTPEFVLQELDKYIYDPQYKIIAHNGLGFDIYLHNIHRRKLGFKTDYSYLSRFIDTNTIARAQKQGISLRTNEDLLAFQFKQYNTPVKGVKTSVAALCKDYNIEYNPELAHGAIYDCELLYQIWKKLVWQFEI